LALAWKSLVAAQGGHFNEMDCPASYCVVNLFENMSSQSNLIFSAKKIQKCSLKFRVIDDQQKGC